jgi:hypothetical protein
VDDGVGGVGGFDCSVAGGVVLDGVDCAHDPTASASANPTSTAAEETIRIALMSHLRLLSIVAACGTRAPGPRVLTL